MVSSGISALTKACAQKSFTRQRFLPMGTPDVIPADHEEFDFADVFGPSAAPSPATAQALIEVNVLTSDNSIPQSVTDGSFYDAPVIIQNRSHSLVGPSPRFNQFLQLSKLTLHETESSLELVEQTKAEKEGQHINDVGENDNSTKEVSGVGLDDFEVLKLVGQGAFGKVFQVKKKGTAEIFAMKVMRKDKIMEKNHAEYMKAEREILTKVDHPFVVQLRYSFQGSLIIMFTL